LEQKNKRIKQDSQNGLKSPISDGDTCMQYLNVYPWCIVLPLLVLTSQSRKYMKQEIVNLIKEIQTICFVGIHVLFMLFVVF